MHEVCCLQDGRRALDDAGEDRAVGRPVDAAKLLHRARGERDLVAAERPEATLDLEQPVHLVLDAIGRLHRARRIGAPQPQEPLAPPVGLEDLLRDALHLVLIHRFVPLLRRLPDRPL